MLTLRSNLQNKVFFLLLDKKVDHAKARELSILLDPELADWMMEYFDWYIKGYSRNMNGQIRKEFDEFRKRVKSKIGPDGMLI